MSLRDLVDVSLTNLWRTRLRAVLTIAGVVIAIATFTALLSFATGNRRYFTTAFNEFGLVNQMSVRPRAGNGADTIAVAVLDGDAVRRMSSIPGVRLAYPFSSFDITAAVADTVVVTSARALPLDAIRTKLFSKVLGGMEFSAETAHEAIVTHEFSNLVGAGPDSLVGQTLIISMRKASVDSGFRAVVGDPIQDAQSLFRSIDPDSIRSRSYRRRILRSQLGERARRFFDGLMNRQATVSDTLRIIGVAPEDKSYRFRTSPVVIPERTARRLSSGGFVIDGNPVELMASVRDGRLFDMSADDDARSYPRITLELEPLTNHKAVRDSVQALGFTAFSFAEQFDEMQRFMVYFYLGLGVIGLIAMATAALGIINTLVMSITERRKEIGILKALGADESDIHRLFLVESAAIGAIGAAVGILIGWAATRVVAIIGKIIMEREGLPVFDPFALPLWLIGLALIFGVLVSLLAGLYPAARAARIDPVEALRSE